MITSKLTGNFGNHLAQYITTRCIAEKIGYSWGFDPKPMYDYYGGKEQLYFFDIDYGNFPTGIQNLYEEHRIFYEHLGDRVDIRVYDENVYNIEDNTELTGGCWQSENYFKDFKKEIKNWIKYKKEFEEHYKNILSSNNIVLDDNLCIINIRGGEYRNYPRLLIEPQYYKNSIDKMLELNRNMKFLVITDDVDYSRQLFPSFPIMPKEIGLNYYTINKAKWMILCNSSFPIFSAWTNETVNMIIAPKYWARHNVSNGYWATGDQYYEGWFYMSREGILEDYNTVKTQSEIWRSSNVV